MFTAVGRTLLGITHNPTVAKVAGGVTTVVGLAFLGQVAQTPIPPPPAHATALN